MTSPLATALNPSEVELKFHLPEGSRVLLECYPALAAVAPAHHHLVSTYFDTPDRALDRFGLTLRVRWDGEKRIQTVKSRSKGHGVAASRGEWEWPIEQDIPEVALLSKTPALAAAACAIKGRLQPAFFTDIRRTTYLLHLDSGTTAEVAFDEGDIHAGLAREPVSELEIELKNGGVEPLYRLAGALLSTAPLWLMSESKASRGWRLRTGQGAGAQLKLPLRFKRSLCADAGFRQLFGATLGHLTVNIGPTLRGDPEGLHQARIAIREARAILQLFDPYLSADSARRFKEALRTHGQILGAARDWDVFCLETLPAAMPDLSSERLEDLNAAAQVERQRAHEAVAAALRGRGFSEMVLGLVCWSDVGALAPSGHDTGLTGRKLSTLASSLLDRASKRVRRRGRHAGRLSETGRHDLRKSLKKLSLDIEALAPFYGTNAVKRYRRRSEALERILGVANDAAVTDGLAHKLVATNRAALSKPAYALEHWNRVRGRKALIGLRAAMRNLRHQPKFWS
ncbi:CHAD domain-containing protein [Methylobacterium sp. BTF04]|uniref:CYTH and CHAD domain-containing protein n=1 Tax=Methylobacterium sp. BTF04 TaxID=2708300 RepID=UPI0013D20443|nr:CYTH and CHAD domain-containing protein [Methylobacterium sp. BTF04]NEU14795.1 CHAD domain-containing protein [Methylobacterium sp. BTF04]